MHQLDQWIDALTQADEALAGVFLKVLVIGVLWLIGGRLLAFGCLFQGGNGCRDLGHGDDAGGVRALADDFQHLFGGLADHGDTAGGTAAEFVQHVVSPLGMHRCLCREGRWASRAHVDYAGFASALTKWSSGRRRAMASAR